MAPPNDRGNADVVSVVYLDTPLAVALRGIASGLAATLLLAMLNRAVGMLLKVLPARDGSRGAQPPGDARAQTLNPTNPEDLNQHRRARAEEGDHDGSSGATTPDVSGRPASTQAGSGRAPDSDTRFGAHATPGVPMAQWASIPAAASGVPVVDAVAPGWSASRRSGGTVVSMASPEGALPKQVSVGTEDLAAEVAFKIGSGIFDRDISGYLATAQFIVHMAYGGVWGLLYGLLQATYQWPVVRFGPLFGVVMWLVGPITLAPAMRVVRPARQQPPAHLVMMLAGHVVYGLALAKVFAVLQPRAWHRSAGD